MNTVAQADAGTGRNSWRSSGDGTFFIGKNNFYALSYRAWSVDVSPPSGGTLKTYTNLNYMTNTANCANGSPATSCGYGGPYQGLASFGSPVANGTFVAPWNGWNNNTASGLNGTATIPAILVTAGTPLNIGDSRLEGIQINYLRFTSYGANY